MAIVTIRVWAKDENFKVKAVPYPYDEECMMIPEDQMLLAGIARDYGLTSEGYEGKLFFIINKFWLTEH